MDLKTNYFRNSTANFANTDASTGSGGVFYIRLENVDIDIGGGEYVGSKAFYGATFYIETFPN